MTQTTAKKKLKGKLFQTIEEPIVYITATLSEITGSKNVVWMAQPEECAVYVHAPEAKVFKQIAAHMEKLVVDINIQMSAADLTGRYYTSADIDRNCLDIYYQRY